uniref:putative disease resistance RPP13-like protein 1 n=1 Tax=Erigeron canadensis TaxID=72917 RepID=UPI001CB8DB5D|nr:putative disease resistance RPP13-like protein 1 [Erigeron canadensis]
MAEIIASAVVTVLIEKLLTAELMNLARSEGLETQLKKLKQNFLLIEAVLADSAQKQNQKPVALWLIELQDLAYDIDDVLDDMATEVLRRKLNHQVSHDSTRASCSKLSKFVPTCCTNNFSPRNFMYGRKISSKLDEVNTRLDELVDQKNKLGLDLNVKLERSNKNKSDVRFHQISYVNESKVLGRENDKEALIGRLLGSEEETSSNQKVISVVSVVGMGGLGKTTLAQLLYNDKRVKDHFELMAWVCVSDDFDVFNISNAIYQSVGGGYTQFATLNLLSVALKEKLSGKRFLVVLDDVWNEEDKKWDLLRSAFDVGAHGSKFLVTTRNKKVASVMDCFQPYVLEVLSDEIALSLFAQSALDEQNFDRHPSLKSIAQGIVKKCDGLPLALVTLGKVLKRKESDDEWEALLNSEIWNLDDESGILPALKLSYYDLPSHLKQVFAYCSLFPKDYEFERKKLVLLWMAQGFVSQTKGKNQPIESLGDKYFEELLSRSFFQPFGKDGSRYIMHDLMNDLATSVAVEFFFRLDENMELNNRNEAYEKFRHFSFIGQQRVTQHKKFKDLHRARRLRTLLPVSVGWGKFKTLDDVTTELLPHLNFLRVLSLTKGSITEVPRSIGNLKHLRYLNFSYTDIQGIPEQVSELYNLQCLLVRDCHKLSSLPVSFVKLINLRHLDMTNTLLLNKLPLGIGGLTSLQTLSKVIIEEGNGFKISELKGLSDLQGKLSIKCLEKVIQPTEAKDAKLQQKTGLYELNMGWSDDFDGFRDPAIEYEVLERLRAPSKLKILRISFYNGMKFPSWIGNPTSSFDHLTELMLIGCENCTELPTLGHLSSLRKLYLIKMKAVQTVSIELLAHTKPFHGDAFPSLESLEVDNMQCLEKWSTSGGDGVETPRSFLRLRGISIIRCPKLDKVSFGLVPSLENLTVEGCPEAVLRDLVGVSSSIRSLDLDAIKGMTQLDTEILKHLGAVEDLTIRNCDELRYLWESSSSSSNLKFVHIANCKNIKSISQEHLQSLTSLEEMVIRECPNMDDSFPSCGLLWPPNLKRLRIGELKKPLSEWGLQNYPSSLVELELYGRDSGVVSFGIIMEEKQDHNNRTSSACFLLPPSLTSLIILDFKEVESVSEVLQHLPQLQHLHIINCPKLRDVPKKTSSLNVFVL